MIYNSLNNSLGGLPGYDAWKTTDVKREKAAEQAEYCDDNHDWDGDGYECPECEEERKRIEEGPDPDRAMEEERDRIWDEQYQNG